MFGVFCVFFPLHILGVAIQTGSLESSLCCWVTALDTCCFCKTHLCSEVNVEKGQWGEFPCLNRACKLRRKLDASIQLSWGRTEVFVFKAQSVSFSVGRKTAFLSFPCVLGNHHLVLSSGYWGRGWQVHSFLLPLCKILISSSLFSKEFLFQLICGVCQGKPKVSENTKQNQLLSTPCFYCKIQIGFVLFLFIYIYI